MFNFKNETYLKIVFIISLFSISAAYFIEYVLGYQPCSLCLIERIPYVLSIILVTTSHFLKKNGKFFVLLLILTFVFSFLISFYHFGIESGFFEESSICSLQNGSKVISKEALLEQLSKKTISCKDVTFKIFGLSLTTINMFLSIILIILSIKNFINYEKLKK